MAPDGGDGDAAGGEPDASGACGAIAVEELRAAGTASGSITAGESRMSSPSCGGAGAEVIYAFAVDAPAGFTLSFDGEGALDAVMYLRGDCLDETAEIACTGPGGSLTIDRLEPGVYYVVVDGVQPGSSGDFTVTAQPISSGSRTCDPDFVLPAADFGTLVDHHDLQATCAPEGAIAENVYELPVPVLSRLAIHVVGLGASPPPALSVRAGDCADPAAEVLCFAGGGAETVESLPPGPYYVVAEGEAGDAFGLAVTGTIPIGSPCIPFHPRFECEAGSGCGWDFVCAVHACSDGIDNDGNGRTDYPGDPGCISAAGDAEDSACPGSSCPACANGIDDDGDGRVDFPADPDCYFAAMSTEQSFACTNDRDDDGDGRIDEVDPGCYGPSPSEVDSCPAGPNCPACGDRIDNDGDGRIDWPAEPGCWDPSSVSESDNCPGQWCRSCSNGRDDDMDGLIDYPLDPHCPTAHHFELHECYESDPFIPVTGPVMTGSTVGATSDRSLEILRACHDDDIDYASPDVVLWLDTPGQLNFLRVDSSGSDFNDIIGIGENGCGNIVRCEWSESDTEVQAYSLVPGVHIHVDGSDGDSGNFELRIEGEITAGEACNPNHIDSGLLWCEPPTLCVGGLCQ